MRNKTIAVMLGMIALPQTGIAKTHDCPGLECAKRVGADNGRGTNLLEVETLFKCHGDSESFDGAMAGLAGDLNGHSRRAFGIVTFGDDGYFAFVRAPYKVSAPVFFVQDDTSFACVTVQHSRTKCPAQPEPEAEIDITVVEINTEADAEDVAPPDNIAEWPSRLLQADFEAQSDVANDDDDEDETAGYNKPQAPLPGNTPAALPEAQEKGLEAKDIPMQAGNIGLREPQAPPATNQPANLPEALEEGLEAEDMDMQAGNIGLREPKAPPAENQPANLPEALEEGLEAEDIPMQMGNIGLREPKAPPATNQPANLPEAQEAGLEAKDIPMQTGNIGLREPQAPPKGNQPAPERDDGETREPGKDDNT